MREQIIVQDFGGKITFHLRAFFFINARVRGKHNIPNNLFHRAFLRKRFIGFHHRALQIPHQDFGAFIREVQDNSFTNIFITDDPERAENDKERQRIF